jgi:prepilin-type N-terminal cleavage/methylation domain-containing protein
MRPRGVTLLELLLAIVLAGLLAGIALTRLVGWRERLVAEEGAAILTAMLDRGRGAAIRLGGPVDIELRGSLLRVVAQRDSGPATVATRSVPTGASVSGLARPIRFGAEGLAVGSSNRTIDVRVGQHARRVVVSRLGRIR